LPTVAPTKVPVAAPTATAVVVPTPLPPPPTPTAVPAVVTAPSMPGGSLVFVRGNPNSGAVLFRLDLPTGRVTQLTQSSAPGNWAPAGSADGQDVVDAAGGDIAIMAADGSGRSILAHSASRKFGSPAWMPDGRVAFDSSSDGAWEIDAVSVAGGAPQPVADVSSLEGPHLPTWPARGGPLAIVGKAGQQSRIYVETADGSFRPVSPEGVEAYAPAWSPDGSRLAFQSGSAALNGIVTVAPDGSGARRVVSPSGGAWARAPVWSPDGRWIAYVSNQMKGTGSDNGDVYIVPSGGGVPQRLTADGTTYDWRLAWLP